VCEVMMKPELISDALERAWGGSWLPQEMQARRERTCGADAEAWSGN